jgi:hypothetical protein
MNFGIFKTMVHQCGWVLGSPKAHIQPPPHQIKYKKKKKKEKKGVEKTEKLKNRPIEK